MPRLLSGIGISTREARSFTATIIAAIIGTLVMGLFANVPYAQAAGMGRIAGQRSNVRRAALHTTRAGAELRAVNIDPFDVGSGLPQGVGSGAERLDDNSLRMGRSVEDKCFHGAAGFLPAPIVTLLR